MTSVYFFVPNIIGYVRIVLALAAFALLSDGRGGMVPATLYIVSQLLDIADGMAARRLGQVSQFGAVLDQVTDRLSTLGLMMICAAVYPQHALLIILAAMGDLGGHWVHTIGALVVGAETHKKIPDGWRVLKWYYEAPYAMLICHGANETVWIALSCIVPLGGTMRAFGHLVIRAALPVCGLKAATNVLQGMLGAKNLVDSRRVK